MLKLQGIAVSPGNAIGEALIITNEGFRIPRRFVTRRFVTRRFVTRDGVDDKLQRSHAVHAGRGSQQLGCRRSLQCHRSRGAAFHPKSAEAADSLGVPVSLCGQMNGNPHYTMLLIGMGVRSLSASPVDAPEITQFCRRVSVGQCLAVTRRAMAMNNAREIGIFLREEFRKVTPEFEALSPS